MSNGAKNRRFLLLISGLAALVLGGASFAWACGPQAVISVKPTSGPPGTQATVSGAGFREGAIEIHWDSATGVVLNRTTGPSFSVGVTIPQANAGVHHIVAVHTETQSTAPASFEVTAAQQPRPDPEPQPQPQPNRGNTSKSVSGGGGGSRATSGGGADRAVQPARSRASQEAPARISATAPASSQPRAVATDSGRVVFGGSVAPATVAGSRRAGGANLSSAGAALGRKPQAAAGVPSERTASADLWSGARSGRSGSLTALEPAPESDSGSLLPVGLGLLAVGAVGLVGGLLIVGTRRRRAARASRTDQRNE